MLLSRTPDSELVAMLADVGLAAQLEDGRSHASLGGVCETFGYVDPLLNDSQRTPHRHRLSCYGRLRYIRSGGDAAAALRTPSVAVYLKGPREGESTPYKSTLSL